MQLLGNPPNILTPGGGPNGPGPIDCRKPTTSVGVGTSSVPYGAFGSFANSNTGVWGYSGPAAGSLQKPGTWYIRIGGSDQNGGSSSSLTPDRTGTDGVTSTTTFTSASAAFTQADVGKGIGIGGGNNPYRIVSVTNATTITLDRSGGSSSGLTWNIGGAMASLALQSNNNGLLGANNTCVRSGDTVYIGAGTYRQVSSINYTGAFNGVLNIVGDVDGSKTGDAGMVQLTAYTTNDKTAPSATTLLNLNGKSNLSFSNIMFVGGNAITVTATTSVSQNITFRDCAFLEGLTAANNRTISATGPFGVAFNWLIDRCLFGPTSETATASILFTGATGSTGGDYSIATVIQNSFFYGTGGVRTIVVNASGALTFKIGGLIVRGCTAIGLPGLFLGFVGSTNSTALPCYVLNCLIQSNNTCLSSNAQTGAIIENYNILKAITPRANVNAGANSVADGSYAPLFHFGQETQWGGLLRRFGEPMSGSPLLGFGSQDPIASNPLDLRGFPRPAGLNAAGSQLAAVGALERANTSTQGTTPAPPSGTYNWKFTGPGYQDFLVPVDTSSTTIACSVQRDSAYAGSLPVIELLANGTLGVAAQSVADTGAASANNTITLAAFTATAVGAVTVRVRSRDLSGGSVVAFSVFTIT